MHSLSHSLPLQVARPKRLVWGIAIAVCLPWPVRAAEAEQPEASSIFARDNLVAWCVVPFDASKRTPASRAKMLRGFGFKKLAYDWRDPHVPTFEKEIVECKKQGIEFFAFWGWHPSIEPLIQKYDIHPQI